MPTDTDSPDVSSLGRSTSADDEVAGLSDYGVGIPELIPLHAHEDYRLSGANRVNLVIPWITRKSTFGGIATAVRFFLSFAQQFAFARIIVSHESKSEFEPEAWVGWSLGDDQLTERCVVFLGDKGQSLSLAATDFFVGTFWPTVIYIKGLLGIQNRQLSAARRFVYLIQDYEPGFYPFSAQHRLARSTYQDREEAIAVFNTPVLSNYFGQNGLDFPCSYDYEPVLNPELEQARGPLRSAVKERVILIYARPRMLRNGFNLIIAALRLWAGSFADAKEWTLLSAGESHPDISFGRGIILKSCGKLSMQEYAKVLSKTWVGLFFMFTPHPGYVSHEMVEFGAWVITNRLEGDGSDLIPPGMIVLDDLMPESIAVALASCCLKFRPGETSLVRETRTLFQNRKVEFPFIPDLIESWISNIEPRPSQDSASGNTDERLSTKGKHVKA